MGITPQQRNQVADDIGRLRVVAASAAESADRIDRQTVAWTTLLDHSRTDPAYELTMQGAMLCALLADAARVFGEVGQRLADSAAAALNNPSHPGAPAPN